MNKIMSARIAFSALLAVALAGCATVHTEDLQSWVGRPVSDLDRHPVFLSMTVVKTRTDDGTETRDYVNGRAIASCSGGGSTSLNGYLSLAQYNSFASCSHSFAACHNIFIIKNGVVQQYSPIGQGGAQCYTNDAARPGFSGSVNIR